MNFVGHIQVALDQLAAGADRSSSLVGSHRGDDHLQLLVGAALPDVAAMGRFRLFHPAEDPTVRSGIALHHRTDDAFHGHQWFRNHSHAVTAGLAALGLPRGAARACGHVGVELLLDGFLLDSSSELVSTTDRAMGSVTRPELGIGDMVEADRRADWQHHLRRTAGWPVPTDYRDPTAVAERLRRILDRRPRLRFDTAQTSQVADVLATQQPVLEKGIDGLLADLAVAVS